LTFPAFLQPLDTKKPAQNSSRLPIVAFDRFGNPAIFFVLEDPWLSVPFSRMVWQYLRIFHFHFNNRANTMPNTDRNATLFLYFLTMEREKG
jgi:hypothetical protein